MNILDKFSKNKPVENTKNVLLKYSMNTSVKPVSQIEEIKEEKLEDKNVPVRKNRNLLKNIEELPTNKLNIISSSSGKTDYDDLPITAAKKQNIKDLTNLNHE